MKVSASTSIEDKAMKRVRQVAKRTHATEAAILRWCVMKGLPEVEREVIGNAAPTVKPLSPDEVAEEVA